MLLRPRALLAIAILAAVLLSSAPAYADDSLTPSPTPPGISEPTLTPTLAPTLTPRPTSTSTPLPPPTPKVEHKRRKKKHLKATPTTKSSPTSTATITAKPEKKKRHKKAKSHKSHKHPKPTATPTPTATRTPEITLNTEDSISPVQCNGSVKHPAHTPFLTSPYHGWTSIVSYFDHDLPSFSQDGLVVTATGLQAQPDSTHHRSDFPAYWNADTRQYLYYDGHNGYDYDLWYQPVYAAASGKVIFADYEYPTMPDHGYGQMVMIQHSGGYVTLYGHFSKFLVKSGEKVKRGQEIGISGNTGHSTGPHLHFTVFHNCTPTDPYGWSGSGPDPLAGYQGESSAFLWSHIPRILNPPPAWPGMDALPTPPVEQIALLRLPATSKGTNAFTAALKAEAKRFQTSLGLTSRDMKVDMLTGAIRLRIAIPFAKLYASKDVVSLSSPDTLDGQKDDMLQALGRAALVKPPPSIHFARSRAWSGYLVQWFGRTLLVGRGKKGTQVDLRLSSGRGGPKTATLQANPSDGSYAVDLGPLSVGERRKVEGTLKGTPQHVRSLRIYPVKPQRPAKVQRSEGTSAHSPIGLITALLLLLAAGIASATLYYRRRSIATP